MGFADFVKFRSEDYKLMQQYYPDSSAFKKLVYCWKKYRYQKKYNFAHMEFFTFHLGEKKKNEIASFYPRKMQAELYRKVNDNNMWAVTKDKFASYIWLKKFYKRQVCAYNPSPNPYVNQYYDMYNWRKDINAFLETHSSFIIKPLAGSCGNGVKIIKQKISDNNPEIRLDSLLSEYSGGFVVEELIHQHEFFASMNSDSLNTIRIHVFNSESYGGGIDVKWPYLRVGRKGSQIDNISSGGIEIVLDERTGEMLFAADGKGVLYSEHPDTQVKFTGKIPFWEELFTTAKNIAKSIPQLKIAGLDMALDSTNGWTLVEINVEPKVDITQLVENHGTRDYMENFGRKCGVL